MSDVWAMEVRAAGIGAFGKLDAASRAGQKTATILDLKDSRPIFRLDYETSAWTDHSAKETGLQCNVFSCENQEAPLLVLNKNGRHTTDVFVGAGEKGMKR